MSTYRSIVMPGNLSAVSASSADGPIFVVSSDGRERNIGLHAVDLSGELLWQHRFDGESGTPRVSHTGTVWIAHRDGSDAALTEMDVSGAIVRSVKPECAPGERIGAFVVLPDGFCMAWLPPRSTRYALSAPVGRVALHSVGGSQIWSTWTELGEVSYRGVVEWRADDDWVGRPKKPWVPEGIEAAWQDPLLVSGNRIAATFEDGAVAGGSGIGVTFLLDSDTGQCIKRTPPNPHGYKAIPRSGEFLVGLQGYGAFTTQHYDGTGALVQEWPTHAMFVVDHNGIIRGPESGNIVSSRSHFAVLEVDGRVTRGPSLNEYTTSYPAIDEHGTTVFWRDGRLVTVDLDLRMRTVLSTASSKDDRVTASRILLLADGRVAFALSYVRDSRESVELIIVDETGLGTLDSGVWPCGDGGLHGNPARFAPELI